MNYLPSNTKTKLIMASLDVDLFEEALNEAIAKLDGRLIDIKFDSLLAPDCGPYTWTALIIYEQDEH